MSKFELGGIPSHVHGLFHMLREKVNQDQGVGAAWADALKSLLLMKDPEEAKKLLEKGIKDSSVEYPLYLMVINDTPKFLPLKRAGVIFDSGWDKVEIGGLVLEVDLSVRPITPQEDRQIVEIADEHSASK